MATMVPHTQHGLSAGWQRWEEVGNEEWKGEGEREKERGNRERGGGGEGKKAAWGEGRAQGCKRRNTLSLALIFAPLFSNNFKTSTFPPRLAQWMAVDSSYAGKVKKGHDVR